MTNTIKKAPLVQRIAFILQQGAEWKPDYILEIEKTWGALTHKGAWVKFDRTPYYTPEMGSGLFRCVIAFQGLIDPSLAARDKLAAMQVEQQLAQSTGNRAINIDIGYMDADKIILPSCKQGPWKVYWGEGIWLDIVMHYAKGVFTGSPWTFEDFARNPYQRDLLLIREKYKKALKTSA